MNDTALEALLRRDRFVIQLALVVLTALTWAYVLWLTRHMAMPGMDMGGMTMDAMAPQARPWAVPDLLFGFTMWSVMMAAMMLPSAAPMILLYARVGRQAKAQDKPFAATGWFAGGYLLAWAGFSALATLLQAALNHAGLLTQRMASANDIMGGLILIAAGIYQATPLKDRCLANCRAPLSFIQRHGGFRGRPLPALLLGVRHGLYCIGCCWVLMLLLFVGGVMNLVWIASLSALVLVEKVMSDGRAVSRAVGIGLFIGGLTLALEYWPRH
jgi:predicted metal-binding membrane protein